MSEQPNDYSKSWNDTYGVAKDPVRNYMIFPLFAERVSQFRHEFVADLGCGNGSMIRNLAHLDFVSCLGLDRNRAFLDSAEKYVNDSRVKFVEEDLANMKSVLTGSIDVALSVFVINELPDLDGFFKNVSRILTPLGRVFLVCTHPFVPLIAQKQADWGVKSNNKVTGLSGYFSSSKGRYHFTLSKDYADYYHYNFQHITTAVCSADLSIRYMQELTSDDPRFQEYQEYWTTRDMPKYLYLEISR